MPPELPGSDLEQYARRLDRQWRKWIRARARWVERIGARDPAHAELPLGLRVVGLEVRITNRPVLEGGTRHRAVPRPLDEILFVKTPVVRGEVHAAAADHATVDQVVASLGLVGGGLPKRLRLQRRDVGELVAFTHQELVVLEVGFVQIGTLLEHQDAKPAARELAGHDAAGRAGADDGEVHVIRRGVADRRRLPNVARHARLHGISRAMTSG